MKKEYLVKNVTMVRMVNFLVEAFGKKKSGEPFTIWDVQGYCRRGNLPKYLGGNPIQQHERSGVNFYSIVK